MAFLEVKNLKKRFGNTRVLHGIDFSMEQGEVVAVIGSSGGGKTTFLRCLNFLERPDEGTISVGGELLIDGADKNTLSEARIRKNRLTSELFHLRHRQRLNCRLRRRPNKRRRLNHPMRRLYLPNPR